MQNKFVCLHCDELLFDMEIEVDGPKVVAAPAPAPKKMPVEVKPKAKLIRLADKKPVEHEPDKQDADMGSDDEDMKSKKAA